MQLRYQRSRCNLIELALTDVEGRSDQYAENRNVPACCCPAGHDSYIGKETDRTDVYYRSEVLLGCRSRSRGSKEGMKENRVLL